MKRMISMLMATMLLTISLTGCGKTEQTEQIQMETPTATEDTETEKSGIVVETKDASEVTITDQLGREVTIPADVERVVSSYYITTSLITALNGADKLVGIEMKAETRPIYQKAAPKLLELSQVGNNKTISVEECAKLDAQVVIIPVKLKEFIEPLEKLGIAVVVVEPETLEQFLDCVSLVGTILNETERAESLRSYYMQKVEFAENLTKDITDKPKVMIYGNEITEAATPQMYQSSVVTMAGGVNVTEGMKDKKWATVSAEQIMEWNPHVMINLSYSEFDMEEIASDSVLAQTEAVKSGQLYTFPSKLEAWDYPTPSSALGILWLTHILHPDVYGEDDFVKEAKDFYKTFYGIDVTEEEIGVL